jgi:hypothetical protein
MSASCITASAVDEQDRTHAPYLPTRLAMLATCLDATTFAPAPRPGRRLAALAADPATCDAWLLAESELRPGLDRKAQAAFLIGRAARSVAYPLAGLLILQSVVPRLVPETLALRPERYRWEHEGEAGEALRYVAQFDPHTPLVAGEQAALHAVLHDSIVATMTPLVTALRAAAGLSPGALWRLVADMVCVAFLNVGEQIGDIPTAQAHALAVTRRAGSPLNNRVSGFQHVTLPDPADPAHVLADKWFLRRGGCCRWYTCPEGECCATCVLLRPEQQQQKLRDYLRRTHEAAA